MLGVVLLFLVGGWFAIRWYVGNTVAEYGPSAEDGGLEAAQVAMRLAPRDPLTHWRLGKLQQRDFANARSDAGAQRFAEAVELSPRDYRLWMDYGRALEETGNIGQAEAALKHSIELAPAYAYPRWYLGNLYLRAGRTDEAFAELQFAAESAQPLRGQVFSLALHVLGDDFVALNKALDGSTELRAQLASYLISNRKLDEALRFWKALTPSEQKDQRVIGEELINALAGVKKYHAALDVARGWGGEASASPKPDEVFDGSFDATSGPNGSTVFGWQITSIPTAQAALDGVQQHSGRRSLRLVFKSTTTLALNTISQLVVVQPQSRYRLEYYVRTDELRSAGTPVVTVTDENDGAVLATSAPVPAGTANWQPFVVEFGTKPATEAIRLRISRAPCGDDPVCPIFGTVWYDDFHIQFAGRAAGTTAANHTSAQ